MKADQENQEGLRVDLSTFIRVLRAFSFRKETLNKRKRKTNENKYIISITFFLLFIKQYNSAFPVILSINAGFYTYKDALFSIKRKGFLTTALYLVWLFGNRSNTNCFP